MPGRLRMSMWRRALGEDSMTCWCTEREQTQGRGNGIWYSSDIPAGRYRTRGTRMAGSGAVNGTGMLSRGRAKAERLSGTEKPRRCAGISRASLQEAGGVFPPGQRQHIVCPSPLEAVSDFWKGECMQREPQCPSRRSSDCDGVMDAFPVQFGTA